MKNSVNEKSSLSQGDFIVKINTWRFRFALIAWFLLLAFTILVNRNSNLSLDKLQIILLATLIGVISIYLISKALSNDIKLIISNDGIMTGKGILIEWSSIWYFHVTNIEMDGESVLQLCIKQKESEKEHKIYLNELDKSPEQIIQAIENRSKEYNIIQLTDEI